MHETLPGARVDGQVLLDGQDIYGRDVNVTAVRQHIGMVFQRPTPFPTMSIRDNVAAGLLTLPHIAQPGARRRNRRARAATGRAVGRGQGPAARQRGRPLGRPAAAPLHCPSARHRARGAPARRADRLARPISTQKVEELVYELRRDMTVVIVTHNMQQAARVSDRTAFMLLGDLVEVAPTSALFTTPKDPRTEAYITGRFG